MSILIRKQCAVGSACFSSFSQSQFLNKQVEEKNKLINGKCMCFEVMPRAALLLEPPSRVFLLLLLLYEFIYLEKRKRVASYCASLRTPTRVLAAIRLTGLFKNNLPLSSTTTPPPSTLSDYQLFCFFFLWPRETRNTVVQWDKRGMRDGEKNYKEKWKLRLEWLL